MNNRPLCEFFNRFAFHGWPRDGVEHIDWVQDFVMEGWVVPPPVVSTFYA